MIDRTKAAGFCSALLCALFVLPELGCGHRQRPGSEPVPPGLVPPSGVYADANPRWSHSGREIAFMRALPDRRMQLFVVDPELERPMALLEAELVSPDRGYSSSRKRYNSPDTIAWSPDDRRIAFERIEWFTFEDSERLPGTGLWSFDLGSGRVGPLALHPTHYRSQFYYYHSPAWSPDGRRLAFVGEGINGQRSLFVYPLGVVDAREVTPRFDGSADSDWPAWRPGGSGALAFRQRIFQPQAAPPTETLRAIHPGGGGEARSGEIWRIAPRRYASLLPGRDPAIPAAPRAGHLDWSPDGKMLAFTLTPDADDYSCYEIWTMRADGSDARRVRSADGRGYFAPVWIGNDRLGALSPVGDRFDVVEIAAATGKTRRLGAVESADCDWSPDRSRIVYAGVRRNSDEVTSLRLLETGVRRDTRRSVDRVE